MKLRPITLSTLLLLLCSFDYDNSGKNNYRYNSRSVDQPELNRLTMILTQFGINPENLNALDYAILKEDEYAVDVLLKYGATPGNRSLSCARQVGNLDLLKKIFEAGARADDFDNDLLLNAISSHQNDIAAYLIDLGNDLGDYVIQEDRDYLKTCQAAENMEIYNLLISKGYRFK
ncbi:MAG: hypothetical protein JSR37_08510 [Verrucomicrobia bacterium]|nr:hypothetical protein [Verrucomicrobiota bacterium]MBS0636730.1 hypothetical protein [Verrucomicrobiota bacterium]